MAMDLAVVLMTGLAAVYKFRQKITNTARPAAKQIQCAIEGHLSEREHATEDETGPVDDQELRNQTCVDFDEHGAEEDDLTAGPTRFVIASDGVKECAALLMTTKLCTAIQEAIDAQKQYVKAERKALDESEYLRTLKADIELEIVGHELRLSGPCDDDTADQAGSEKLQAELVNLRGLLEDVDDRQYSVDDLLRGQANTVRAFQGDVLAYLEEAFAVANLVEQTEEQPDPPVERLTLQEEYHKFCEQRQEVYDDYEQSDGGSEYALDITRDEDLAPPPPELTPEEQVFYQARKNFFEAQHRLQSATARFERKEYDREAERETSVESREEFDLRWVEQYAEVTRELIASEDALAEAKAAALAAGVDFHDDDQSSGFRGGDDDGYRLSQEAACIAAAPVSKILPWLETIPDAVIEDVHNQDVEIDGKVEVDDWNAAEVEIGDSTSCIMTGSRRRRVARYQQDCEALR